MDEIIEVFWAGFRKRSIAFQENGSASQPAPANLQIVWSPTDGAPSMLADVFFHPEVIDGMAKADSARREQIVERAVGMLSLRLVENDLGGARQPRVHVKISPESLQS